MSGEHRLAPSTIRGYHLTLRMFCDYLCDPRYGWVQECADRFDQVPSQPCHEWNTVAHLNDYEGNPARRPFSYDELSSSSTTSTTGSNGWLVRAARERSSRCATPR